MLSALCSMLPCSTRSASLPANIAMTVTWPIAHLSYLANSKECSNAVIEAKRLGLLREIKPAIATVGALLNPDSLTAVSQQKDIEEAAQTVGLRVQFLKASNELELEAAFQAIVENRIRRFWCRIRFFCRLPR